MRKNAGGKAMSSPKQQVDNSSLRVVAHAVIFWQIAYKTSGTRTLT